MQPWKRVLIFLLLNVIISAGTTLAVLLIWDFTHPAAGTAPSGQAAAQNPPLPSMETAQPPATASVLMDEYVVREGDTLGQIADKYKVSVDTLLKANGLKDPNAISVGMAIYIPLTPEVFPTNTPVVTRTPMGATPTLAPGAQAPGVTISSVIGVGDLASERVFITRTGSGVLIMNGWKLADEDGNVFVFPELALFEGGAVNVWTSSGTITVVDLYWGLSSAVWQSGETATLYDDQGKVAATYTIP
jgi:LysM repeat protein